MEKKGIVLLITLLFIGAISLLIVKNIDDSQKIIHYGSTNTNLVQFQNGISNINNEVKKFFKEKDLDDFPEEIYGQELPLEFGKISVLLQIERFYGDGYIVDINLTKKLQDNQIFLLNEYKLNQLITQYNNEYQGIKNQKQLDFLIDEYLLSNEDEVFVGIKDLLLPETLKDINCSDSCLDVKYSVMIDNLIADVRLIFNTSQSSKEYREISIKREE